MAAFLISLLTVVAHGGLVFWRQFSLQREIPLWYSMAEDNNQLADKKYLWVLPIIGAGILLVSLLLKLIVKKDDDAKALRRVIGWLTVVWEILLLIITTRIILLVT
jgi:hypothetical protein